MIVRLSPLFVLFGLSWGLTILGGGKVAQVELVGCNFSEVEFFFYTGELSAEAIQTDAGDFVQLYMNGATPSSEIGYAEMPVVRVFVEIPQEATPSLEVLPIETATLNLDDFGLPELIYPRQQPVPKLQNYEPRFTIDWDFYSSDDTQFSSDAEIIQLFDARDHRIALVEIHPVNYFPSRGQLTVLISAKITVHTPDADIARTKQQKMQHRSPYFDNIIEPFVINSSFYSSLWVVPTEIEMIVVADASFTSQLSELEHWKSRKGFKVDVKTASELGGTASGIKNYIQNQYDSDDVDFVLLVGDVAQIPTYTGGSSGSSSDNPYSELAGSDYIPDCFVGRLSLTTTTQVSEMANRTVAYERFGFGTGTNWTLGACLPASDDATYHTLAENTQRYVANNHFGPYGYTRIDTIWAYYGGTGTDVINSTNAGVMILIYSGHGYNAGWAGPAVDQDDVRNLSNQGKYPMVISHACQTGMFGEYAECFMETWIRQTNRGAIAALGASDYAYWYEDDYMERRMIDSVFIGEWMFTGGMRLKGLMEVLNSAPGSAEYYFDMYNLLGDPSVALWWGVPQSINAIYTGTTPPGDGTIDFTVSSEGSPLEEALVCITDDASNHDAEYTNVSGNATLSYFGVSEGETLWVTITAYNRIPHEGYIVVSGSGPFLVYESNAVQDDGGYGSSGDGDNIADAGETIALWVALRNSGTENAIGVSANIAEGSPYATITDNASSYGTVLAGATDGASDPFVLQITGTPPDETPISFDLTITDSNDSVWTDAFSITLRAPDMELVSYDLTDIGDGDGLVEPGEQVDIQTIIHNDGGEHSRSVSGTIAETDPYLTIITGTTSFGDIVPGADGTNSPQYRLNISPSCPDPYIAHIVHTATDIRGYECTDTITIFIGSGGFVDDMESGLSLWSATEPWHITDYRYNSPGHCLYAGDESWSQPFQYHDTTNASITTANAIVLPPDPRLTFWHYYETEDGYDSCFVEISTDGGLSWERLAAYCGPSFGWKFVSADLSPYGATGDQILLRFRFYADVGVHNHGWFIDDVSVLSAQNGYVGAGDVFPRAGIASDTFTFKVTYASPDGFPPTNATVYIDDIPYTMTDSEGATTTGRTFSYSTPLTNGVHSYYFVIQSDTDEYRFPQFGELSGPVVGSPLYSFNLGETDGGFTTQSFSYYQDWEWGVPTYGPSSVPYGTTCWGTELNTTYHDSSQSRLKSPTVFVPDDGGKHYIVIRHWYRVQPNDIPLKHDGGNVRISVDGGNSFIIFPQGGYDGIASRYNQFTRYLPIFGDTMSDFWQEEAFDITPWAGHSIQTYFDFGSSSRNVEAGWYINYLYFFSSVATEITEQSKPTVPININLSAYPNPFNSSCEISVEPYGVCVSQIEVEIYDLRGNLVSSFNKAPCIWEPGESVSSGVYLVKAKVGESTASKKIVLVK